MKIVFKRNSVLPLSVTRYCEDCQHLKTPDCPNGTKCYSLKDKPYFVPHSRFYECGRKSKHFSNNIIIASVVAVSMFTVLAFIGQFAFNIDIPAHWWASWFGFWGVEIITLATITHRKINASKSNNKVESNGDENV